LNSLFARFQEILLAVLKKLAPYVLLGAAIAVMWAQIIEKFNFKV